MSSIVQALVTQRSSLRRALAVSVVLHAIAAALAWWSVDGTRGVARDTVDIELAPVAPAPEALPAEVAKRPEPPRPAEQVPAAAALPGSQEEAAVAPVDAGVDAPVDAPVDARPKRIPRDAAIDAPVDAEGSDADAPADAPADAMDVAGVDDAGAPGDAGAVAIAEDAGSDAATIAEGSGAGSGSATIAALPGSGVGSAAGSGSAVPAVSTSTSAGAAELDTAALVAALAAGAQPGATTEPAVPGAPTTAGTAANLLAYFPDGHMITALIRFDRLRGTEWAAPTERLLRPMPDYQLLFGSREANLTAKLDTLIISTPRPRDAAATTLVGKTTLGRRPLRDFLGQAGPIAWTATQSGLVGNRTGKRPPNDPRVFVSPYKGWFLLAQPGDVGPLAVTRGNLDTVEATAPQPAWITGLRAIERETSAAPDDPRGPALVVSVAFGGKRIRIGDLGLGLGVSSVPKPARISLAMELVKQGWLIRGNLRFATEADATEAIETVKKLQRRVADSRAIQLVIGKPIAHVVASLAFAQTGPRVSYATSMSIADARALLAFAAAQVDAYFASLGAAPPPADKH